MYKSGTVPRTSFDHFGLCLFSLRNSLIYTTAVPPRLSIYHRYQSFISNTTGFDNVIHMADRVNDHGFTLRYHCDRTNYTISSAETLLTTSNLSRAILCLGVPNMERYFCTIISDGPSTLLTSLYSVEYLWRTHWDGSYQLTSSLWYCLKRRLVNK